MKSLIIAAAILFAGMAHAEEKTASKPAAPQPNPYTNDQINEVLESQGRRPLFSSRVLHDDNARASTHKSTSSSTLTIRHD